MQTGALILSTAQGCFKTGWFAFTQLISLMAKGQTKETLSWCFTVHFYRILASSPLFSSHGIICLATLSAAQRATFKQNLYIMCQVNSLVCCSPSVP